ncbi:MAG: thiamine phosphate synthase [Verrucomicrobiota bacterium]|nr:thiamine phosphate synthase [Verrucomicrobiota bacterium]
MRRIEECQLYTFVDFAYLKGRTPSELCRALCEGGSDIIQLRAKQADRATVKATAEELLPITRTFGVPLVINDYWDCAEELGSEFCHLGQEDFFDRNLSHHRDLAGGSRHAPGLGLSTHSPEQAARALKADPSYIAIGPVYATGTKPTARPVTLEYVRWAASNVSIPWFAIGGINLGTLDEVLEAGASRVCVVSAILNERDIVKACQQFKERLPSIPLIRK